MSPSCGAKPPIDRHLELAGQSRVTGNVHLVVLNAGREAADLDFERTAIGLRVIAVDRNDSGGVSGATRPSFDTPPRTNWPRREPPLATATDPATLPLPCMVAPAFTTTGLVMEPFTVSVPALTVVPPVKLLTPERVNIPTFSFVRLPEPVMLPAYSPSELWSKTTAALFVMRPCKLSELPCKVPAATVVPPV